MEAEWHNRTDFAPFAEALGIDTDAVLSAVKTKGMWLILYTEEPTADPEAWIMLAVLDADADGILIATRRSRFKTVAEFNDELREHMEHAMKGELGE